MQLFYLVCHQSSIVRRKPLIVRGELRQTIYVSRPTISRLIRGLLSVFCLKDKTQFVFVILLISIINQLPIVRVFGQPPSGFRNQLDFA
jgi:hypothetical protein